MTTGSCFSISLRRLIRVLPSYLSPLSDSWNSRQYRSPGQHQTGKPDTAARKTARYRGAPQVSTQHAWSAFRQCVLHFSLAVLFGGGGLRTRISVSMSNSRSALVHLHSSFTKQKRAILFSLLLYFIQREKVIFIGWR